MIPVPGATLRGHLSGGSRKVAASVADNLISRLKQQSHMPHTPNIVGLDTSHQKLGLFPFLDLIWTFFLCSKPSIPPLDIRINKAKEKVLGSSKGYVRSLSLTWVSNWYPQPHPTYMFLTWSVRNLRIHSFLQRRKSFFACNMLMPGSCDLYHPDSNIFLSQTPPCASVSLLHSQKKWKDLQWMCETPSKEIDTFEGLV